MPRLGADMEAGTLVAWRKQPGEHVARGEIVAEVETDKGLIEVEIFISGTIARILVAPGEKVPVGTVLALIDEDAVPAAAAMDAEAATRAAGPPGAAAAGLTARVAAAAVPAAPPSPPPAPGAVRLRVSPAARARAAELGVDLAAIAGSGPEGAVTRADVERAAATRAAAAPGGEVPAAAERVAGEEPAAAERVARMRQAIGAAMARSKREIPHYYLATTIDLGRATSWLASENLSRPVSDRLLSGVLLLKAVALALRATPELNGVWQEGRAMPSPDIHLGVAIALRGGGLITPALHYADRQSLEALMRSFRDLVTRARTGALRSSELTDATITVTSLGEQGVESVFGVIYPPQLAIVGFGKVVERPWISAGAVVARPLVTATLSADHRASDGHRGARFLAAVDRLLQEPERL